MKAPTSKKKMAFILRQEGKSYNEISKSLGLAKSTLSYWFHDNKQSQTVKTELTRKAQKANVEKLRLMAQANRQKFQKRRAEYRVNAQRIYSTIKHEPLFLTGVALYWGEGDKSVRNNTVRLGNIDAGLLRIFLNFITTYSSVPRKRICVWMLLYPDCNEQASQKFWSLALQLPRDQFRKTQWTAGKGRNRLAHGVCYLYITNTELKETILEWIRLTGTSFIPTHAGII